MKLAENIGNFRKYRIWLDEHSLSACGPGKVISATIPATHIGKAESHRIAMELFIAPRYYAFLGFDYCYNIGNELIVKVNVTSHSDDRTIETLSFPSDQVHDGISSEYAQTILDTAVRVLGESNNRPSGELTFDIGKHSDYGSCKVVFSKVAGILIRMLLDSNNIMAEDKLDEFINGELGKTLDSDMQR
jgi:hypothetical protein